jgi:hypothetical protein
MQAINQFYPPATSSLEEWILVPFRKQFWWAPEPVWMTCRRKLYRAIAGNRTHDSLADQPIPRRCTTSINHGFKSSLGKRWDLVHDSCKLMVIGWVGVRGDFFPLAHLLGSLLPYRSTGLITQFLDLSQAVGLLGCVISSSQGLYLNTGQHKHR